MINITRSEQNTVVVTLTEKTTIDVTAPNAGYVFRFFNPSTNQAVIFTATDVSTAKTRFNQFVIEEVEVINIDTALGKINLTPTGTWHYEIYESEDVSTNLADESVAGLTAVETGIVYVTETEVILPTYDPTVIEKPAYDPN